MEEGCRVTWHSYRPSYQYQYVCVCAAFYVGIIMLICTLSLVMNIIVLGIYHRSHGVPKWVCLYNLDAFYAAVSQ